MLMVTSRKNKNNYSVLGRLRKADLKVQTTLGYTPELIQVRKKKKKKKKDNPMASEGEGKGGKREVEIGNCLE
jgi:hypothetical protein